MLNCAEWIVDLRILWQVGQPAGFCNTPGLRVMAVSEEEKGLVRGAIRVKLTGFGNQLYIGYERGEEAKMTPRF